MTVDTSKMEKGNDQKIEDQYVEASFSDPLSSEQLKLERQTVFRLDIVLVPMVCAIYLLSFLDRANIGNARIAGLQQDLRLTDNQYQTAITLTYVTYIIAELPSNLVFKQVGAKTMLPLMCFCWGAVTVLQGLVTNYQGLLACRAFLGFFEGGMFPGIVLYLSGFYKPHELQVRIGLFFSAAALSAAFSGLLAAAIQKMNGVAGLSGWKWIFVLEGLFTVCFALFAYWMLPNIPHQVKSFNKEQADWCQQRLRSTTSTENYNISIKAVLSTFKDIHIWLMCIILFCNGVCTFGLAYFTPSIVAAMGFNKTKTQLFSVPPFACAFVLTMISAYIADRYRARGATAICTMGIAVAGFGVFMTHQGRHAKYAALCLMVSGVYSASPSLISWIPNNVAAHSRRTTAIAMGFMSTSIGGIVSTWLYPRKTAPGYALAARFNIAVGAICIFLIVVEIILLRWYNQRKKAGKKDHLLNKVEDLSIAEQHDYLGDHHPHYRYTL